MNNTITIPCQELFVLLRHLRSLRHLGIGETSTTRVNWACGTIERWLIDYGHILMDCLCPSAAEAGRANASCPIHGGTVPL